MDNEFRPLVRQFLTPDGFAFNFTYGGCQKFCGNMQDKFSVLLEPLNGCNPQCVCVKTPAYTVDKNGILHIDFEVVTNNVPLGVLFKYATDCVSDKYPRARETAEFNVVINHLLDVFATTVHESGLELFQYGHAIIEVAEIVTGERPREDDAIARMNSETRYAVTVDVHNNEFACDNVRFVAFTMEFLRFFLACVNIVAGGYMFNVVIPSLRTVAARMLRADVQSNFFPDAIGETIQYIGSLIDDATPSREDIPQERGQ